MGTNIKTEYSDRVRYFLSSRTFGTIKIDEPIGWDEDEKELIRNEDKDGIFRNLSNSLKFTKDAKEFIEIVRLTDGINAELILTKETKNDQTDEWENSYTGYLDLSTREVQDNQLSLKFNSGGLDSILKVRESDDVEIDRTDTIDGKTIDPLKTVNIELAGRRIFLESTWKAAPMTYYKNILAKTAATTGGTRTTTNSLPFDITKKSQEEATETFDGADGNFENGQGTMMLLTNVDRKREFKVNIDNLIFICYAIENSPVDWAHINVSLTKYSNGGNVNRQQKVDIL